VDTSTTPFTTGALTGKLSAYTGGTFNPTNKKTVVANIATIHLSFMNLSSLTLPIQSFYSGALSFNIFIGHLFSENPK
jgi:hypothetical protein